MIEGVDYSWSRPNPASLYAAGYRFAGRYVGPGAAGKHLTRGEADALIAAGLSIVAHAEGAEGSALGGFGTGVDHARSAYAMAIACGMPSYRPIYLSIDFGPTGDQWPAVKAYLEGAASAIGRALVGVYGGYETIQRSHDGGWATWLWQAHAWSSWRDPDGVVRVHWHPAAQVLQYSTEVSLPGGATVDLDRALVADFGQWPYGDGEDMKALMRWSGSGAVFLTDGVLARWLTTPEEVADYQQLSAEGTLPLGFGGQIRAVGRKELIGKIVGARPPEFGPEYAAGLSTQLAAAEFTAAEAQPQIDAADG